MKKSDAALLQIAELKRQQAESQYQAVILEARKLDAEIDRLRQQVAGMLPKPGDDASVAMVQQQYAERLIFHTKRLEAARQALLPALQDAQYALQKAMFSEKQLGSNAR